MGNIRNSQDLNYGPLCTTEMGCHWPRSTVISGRTEAT